MAVLEPSSPSLVPRRRAGRHADGCGASAEPFAIGAFDPDQVIGSHARARAVRTARARPGADRGGPHRARSCRVDLSHRRGSDRHACATPGRRGGRFGSGRWPRFRAISRWSFWSPLSGVRTSRWSFAPAAQAELLRGLEALAIDVVLTNLVPGARYVQPLSRARPLQTACQPDRYAAAARSRSRSLVELIGTEPLVLPTPESALRASFDALVERLGVVPKIAAEVDDMAMLRLLTRANAGLAVIPPIVVRDELNAGILVERAQFDGISERFCASPCSGVSRTPSSPNCSTHSSSIAGDGMALKPKHRVRLPA
jgi:hypothetical protein